MASAAKKWPSGINACFLAAESICGANVVLLSIHSDSPRKDNYWDTFPGSYSKSKKMVRLKKFSSCVDRFHDGIGWARLNHDKWNLMHLPSLWYEHVKHGHRSRNRRPSHLSWSWMLSRHHPCSQYKSGILLRFQDHNHSLMKLCTRELLKHPPQQLIRWRIRWWNEVL